MRLVAECAHSRHRYTKQGRVVCFAGVSGWSSISQLLSIRSRAAAIHATNLLYDIAVLPVLAISSSTCPLSSSWPARISPLNQEALVRLRLSSSKRKKKNPKSITNNSSSDTYWPRDLSFKAAHPCQFLIKQPVANTWDIGKPLMETLIGTTSTYKHLLHSTMSDTRTPKGR